MAAPRAGTRGAYSGRIRRAWRAACSAMPSPRRTTSNGERRPPGRCGAGPARRPGVRRARAPARPHARRPAEPAAPCVRPAPRGWAACQLNHAVADQGVELLAAERGGRHLGQRRELGDREPETAHFLCHACRRSGPTACSRLEQLADQAGGLGRQPAGVSRRLRLARLPARVQPPREGAGAIGVEPLAERDGRAAQSVAAADRRRPQELGVARGELLALASDSVEEHCDVVGRRGSPRAGRTRRRGRRAAQAPPAREAAPNTRGP